jgi:putative endopeptidase
VNAWGDEYAHRAILKPYLYSRSGHARCFQDLSDTRAASAAAGAVARRIHGHLPIERANFRSRIAWCRTFVARQNLQPLPGLLPLRERQLAEKNPIPAAYPSWGRFNELVVHNREHLRQILEKASQDRAAAAGTNEQKIGDYYASCMNVSQIDAAGVKPLQPEFDRIQAIASAKDFQAELACLQMLGIDVVFNFGSTQDWKNSFQVIGSADQGGIGLPDRDYYLKTDDKSKQLRAQYVAHVTKMLQLLGDDSAKSAAEAKTIMDIETNLAHASMDVVERRDPDKTYHKMSISQLQALTPSFSWQSYFHEIGAPNMDSVAAVVLRFSEGVNLDLKSVSLDDWKIYLRWHLINSTAHWLSQPFVGYPDKWRDYSAYRVDRGPFVLDTLRGDEFESRRDLNKIGKPVE